MRHGIASILLLLVTGACNHVYVPVAVDATLPVPGTTTFSDPIDVVAEAIDGRQNPRKVGHATVSLFAIPAGDILGQRFPQKEVPVLIASTLRSVGYRARVVDAARASAGETPTMIIEIQEFEFSNYTWLSPFYVPTSGSISLSVVLHGLTGREVYRESFVGEGKSTCFDPAECGFEEAIRMALSEILDRIVVAAVSDPFRQSFRDIARPDSEGMGP